METTAGPSILKNTTDNISQSATQISKNPGNWFKTNWLKVVIIVLVVGVLAEIVFGAYSLFSPSSGGSLNLLAPEANEMRSAQFSLVPDKTSYKKGDVVTVDVKLFTGGYMTDSADLVVKYDPAFLSAADTNFATEGQIYSEYPAVQVDKENGLIGISGITLPGQNSFSGVGSFAKLNFTALKDGQTQVSIDFQPNSTADSNVVLSGSSQDVIGSVVNADINISDTAPAAMEIKSCEGFKQSCQDSEGRSGTQQCTGGAIVDSSCGYDPKLTVSCEVCKI